MCMMLPLSGCAAPPHAPRPSFTFDLPSDPSLVSLAKLEEQLASARSAGKPVMVDFYARWCAACRVLDRETYAASNVMRATRRFVTIRVDATNEDDAVMALARRFDVRGLPTIAFVSSNGDVLAAPHITGFVGPDAFVSELEKVP